MPVVVITPPELLVSLALAKKHLRLDHPDDDDLVEAYLAAVCGHIDGPAGWLGRSIGEQTLELSVAEWGSALALPYGPVSSVASVKYLDVLGVEQTLDPAYYGLAHGRLYLRPWARWPSTQDAPDAIRVRYVAGQAGTVPPAVVAAVLLMVGDLYANRETGVTGTVTAPVKMSITVENLLAPFRVWQA